MKFFKKKQKDKSGNKNAAVAAEKARSKQDSLLENAHMEEPVVVSKSIEESKSGATVEETFQDEIESESPSKGIKARTAVLLVSAVMLCDLRDLERFCSNESSHLWLSIKLLINLSIPG